MLLASCYSGQPREGQPPPQPSLGHVGASAFLTSGPAPSARVEDLEEFIDHYYYECVMEGPADNPNKRKKTDSATDTQDLLSSEFSVLESINKKLEVLGMLHQEIKDLKRRSRQM
ncbi:hypothetical protein ABVT39_009000 [Epinephelus coioides]